MSKTKRNLGGSYQLYDIGCMCRTWFVLPFVRKGGGKIKLNAVEEILRKTQVPTLENVILKHRLIQTYSAAFFFWTNF